MRTICMVLGLVVLSSLSGWSQCPVPSGLTATPSVLTCGGICSLSATATGSNIEWFTSPTGGSLIGSTVSGGILTVAPTVTTTYYAGSVQASTSTQTFGYTGSYQIWVVPANCYSINVDMSGAQGGSWQCTGGYGGRLEATRSVTPGDTLFLYVGGQGTVYLGGWNGGGNGSPSSGGGCGGGGASDIRLGGKTFYNRILVAGAGGGAGYACGGSSDDGGVGGDLNAGQGRRCNSFDSYYCGDAGTQGNGGYGGGGGGFPGDYGLGGNASYTTYSGGGGGGYFGGGGGYQDGSGGGGSSYTDGYSSNVTHTQGYKTGDGEIIITYTVINCVSLIRTPVVVSVNPLLPPVSVTANPDTINCAGSSNLSAISPGNQIYWYDSVSGGNMLGSSQSGLDFTVYPNVTTTYYAQTSSGGGYYSTVFNYTGTTEYWIVPPGVTRIDVYANGAQGGSYWESGGYGGYVQATLDVIPGQLLYINVGGQGGNNAGGFNGGGNGSVNNYPYSSGGGGASDIRLGGNTYYHRILVAGGGGGASYNCGSNCEEGGPGGGLTAGNGKYCCSYNYYYAGGGANQSGGGNGAGYGGNAGSWGTGGDANAYNQAGGGGGGYYGGGGGYENGSGGGGSSYVTPFGSSNIVHSRGVRSGHGDITIAYTIPACNSVTRIPVVVHAIIPSISNISATPAVINCSDTVKLSAVSAGNTIRWYTVRSGGSPIGTTLSGADLPLIPAITTTYYAEAVNGFQCVSQGRDSIIVTVTPIAVPSNITATPSSITCGTSVNLNATSTGNIIKWYTSWTGGTSLGTSASGANFNITPSNSTVYYAEAILGTQCISASRDSVSVTVNPIGSPTSVTASPSTVSCGSSTNLSAVAAGSTIYWFTSQTGGATIGTSASGANFSVTPTVTTTYYAAATSGTQTITQTFTNTSTGRTGSLQNWTVPAGITQITIEAYGAQGGGGINNSLAGGKGAYVKGDFTVVPGSVLNILIGQMGGTGSQTYDPHGNENGGGGGTFVVLQTGNSPLIIAGGGGGGPSTSYGTACTRTAANGEGKTATSGVTISCSSTGNGGSGGNGGSASGYMTGGAGGGFYSDGANGGGHCSTAIGGRSFFNGADGGTGNTCYGNNNWGGYGGGGGGQLGGPGAGGGYSGGGTAASWSSYSTWGGGGGSYNSGTNQSGTNGANTGHGKVIISYTVPLCYSTRVPVVVTSTPPASPTQVTATPPAISCAGTALLNATSAGNTIEWYTTPTGGSSIGTTASGANLQVSPSDTTTYYAVAVIGGMQSQTFNFTGSVQTWTVPTGVTTVRIDALGAQGGSNNYSTGGYGGRAQADIPVVPGQTLNIYVGGQGTNGSSGGGWNGGGNPSYTSYTYARGGGGGSDVRIGGTVLTNRVIVAGGGGGSGYFSSSMCNGGAAGAPVGGKGYYQNSYNTSYCGSGGTQIAGGIAGTYYSSQAGSLGLGGNSWTSAGSYGSGGGGGGYYGGGAGAYRGGGGGGSSWVTPSGTSNVSMQGYNTGNGKITISWTPPICRSARVPVTVNVYDVQAPASVTATPSSVQCSGISELTAVSAGAVIEWYTDSTGGTSIGRTNSGDSLPVTSVTTTTYYAQAVSGGTDTVITFNYTGNIDSWTVPADITSIKIEAAGAGGGRATNYTSYPGRGAKMSGDFVVTPGQKFKILVGQKGTDATTYGGGGGGTFVTTTTNAPVIIAGGGGGAQTSNDYRTSYSDANTGTSGRNSSNGQLGGGGGGGLLTDGGYNGYGMGGRSFVNGGAGGLSCNPLYSGNGGFGGGGGAEACNWNCSGGGGGYSGGNGGTAGNGGTTGGYTSGGGGSFNNGTNQINLSGAQSGNGYVMITYTRPYCNNPVRVPVVVTVSPLTAPSVTATPDTVTCNGSSDLAATGYGYGIAWYDAPNGGNLLGSTNNGDNFNVSPPATTTYYAEAISLLSGSQTFNTTGSGMTGSLQYFTVPAGVTNINIEAFGAQGGNSSQGTGGLGAKMSGDFVVTPGEILTLLVGQQGPSQGNDGGGGGGTFVVNSSSTPLIIAGGGGGASYSSPTNGIDATITTSGTAGANGGTGGTAGSGGTSDGCAGAGAGFSGNGGNGPSCGSSCNGGMSFLNGGDGGCTSSSCTGGFGGGGGTHGGGWGGGGGGGYSGGGASTSSQFGGGGGGSFNSGTNQINTAGVNNGDGKIIISWNLLLCSSANRTPVKVSVIPLLPATNVNANPDTLWCGGTSDLTAFSTGNTIRWYDSIQAGNLLGTSPGGMPFTVNPQITTTYYAEVYNGTCSNPVRVPVKVVVNALPSATAVTASPDTVNCGTTVNLNATSVAGTINWFTTSSGGSAFGSSLSGTDFPIIPDTTTTYYAEVGLGQCTSSSRIPVTVAVIEPTVPTAVTVTPDTIICGGQVALNATSSGYDITWYTSPTGGNAVGTSASGADFFITPLMTTTYYAEATLGLCASPVRTPVVAHIISPVDPAAVTATPDTVSCGTPVLLNATSSGNTINWYTTATGGSVIATSLSGEDLSIVPSTTTTYYAEAAQGNCLSILRIPVVVSVIAPADPTTVTATPSTVSCGMSTNLNAVASGDQIYWYTSSTGGSSLGTSVSGANFTVYPDTTTTYYAESSFGGPVTVVFNFTGVIQNWVVPAGVTSIVVNAKGAEGSTYDSAYGYPGKGGMVTATLAVTPGQNMYVKVGGKPATYQTFGWNGGAYGSGFSGYYGGGGGGASDIRIGDTNLTDVVIVAGGGGGAGYGTTGCHGGDGGGSYYAGDGFYNNAYDSYYCGAGGSPSGGGSGAGGGGTAGTFGYGGDAYCCSGNGEGGGGGGYYGGGGGYYYGGGGGGSSWVTPTGTSDITYVQGGNTGNGVVSITYNTTVCPGANRIPVTVTVQPVQNATSVTAVPDTLCAGGQTVLTASALAGSINWYTSPTGGTIIGNTPSGTGLPVTVSATTTYYAEAFSAGGGSLVFDYTGGVQQWVVPAGVYSIDADVFGAQGGNGYYGYSSGGNGGRTQSTLSVTPGQTLYVFVGGQGSYGNNPGWNGGGLGVPSYPEYSGCGGGASDIRRGGLTLNDRIIVAGGGGGTGHQCGSGYENGGSGGDTIGGNGIDCLHYYYSSCGGGGTQISGGTGAGSGGGAGGFGYGGYGYYNYGGGGGGGYYGGGGGYSTGSGGGGSSWVTPSGSSNTQYAQGVRTGSGQVKISWNGASCSSTSRVPVVVVTRPDPTLSVMPVSDTLCIGGSDTLHAVASGGLGTFSYYWSESTTDCNSGWSIIPGADSSSLVIPSLLQTTYYKCIITQSGNGCDPVVSSCISMVAYPDPIAPAISGLPSDTSICDNQQLTVSVNNGSGGFGSCTDEFRYSTDSGAVWSSWSSVVPVFTAIAGTNMVESRRNCGEPGCNSTIERVVWNVIPQPIAPVLVKVPAADSVCGGTNISAALMTPGSGGIGNCADYYQYRFDGGPWQPYVLTNNLSTAGHTVAQIRAVKGNCTPGSGCQSENIYTWIISNASLLPPQLAKTPALNSVCDGADVSAVISNAGSGGIGCGDYMEVSIDGAPYQPYGAGTLISTTGHTSVTIRGYHGNCDTLSGCGTSAPALVNWTVNAQPVSPVVSRNPNTDSVCDGTLISASVIPGYGGTSCTDSLQYRTLDNFGWSAWHNYFAGTLLSSSGKDSVQIKGFRGNCDPAAGCMAGNMNLITWVVASQVSSPVIAKTPNAPVVCMGTVLSGTASGGSGGIAPLTYEYEYMEPGTNAWVSGQSWTPAAPGLAYLRARTVSSGTGCGVSAWEVVAWTVTPDPVLTSVLTDTVCNGGSTILNIGVSGGSGTATYQWESSTAGCNGPWTQAGTNSPDLNTGTLSATEYFRCTVTQSGSSCYATSQCITVAVIPDPVVTGPADDTICSGQSTNLSVISAGGYGTPQYQWQQSVSGCGGPWINMGGNTNNLNTGSLTATTTFRCIVTQPGSGGCQGISSCATVYVPSQPTEPVLTPQPNAAVVCLGTTLSGTAGGGTGGLAPLTYEYEYMEPGTSNWVSGQSWTPTAPGTAYLRARTVSAGTGCGVSAWEVVAWTVTPDPVITSVLTDTVCNGGSTILNIGVSGGSGTPTYQWESSTTGCNGPWIQTGTNNPYIHTVALNATEYYRCTVTQSGSSCNATSQCITVAVIPDPVVTGPADDTICSGQSANLSVTSTGGFGTPQYQWQQSTTGCNGPWLNIGGNVSSYNTGSLNITTYYHCIVTQPGIGGCQSTTGCATITVPGAPTQPVLTGTPGSAVVCMGTTLSGMASGGTGGIAPLTYEYEYMEPGTNSWVSGQSWTPAAPGVAYMRARTVSSGTGCGVSAWEVMAWTVVPGLALNGPADDSVCYNTSADLTVSVAGGIGPVNHQWQYSSAGCMGPWTNVGTNSPLYNTGALVADGYYRCVVNLAGSYCGDTSSCAYVRVIQIPNVTAAADAQICSGDTASLSVAVNGGEGTISYQWQYSASGCGGGWINASSDSATILAGAAGAYQCVVTQSTGNCAVTSGCAVITVNPVYHFSESANICAGDFYNWQNTDYYQSGNYVVNYTTAAGCDSSYTLVLVVDTVNTGFTVSGAVITADAASGSYQWLDCDNAYAPITGETGQSYTATADGNYAVIVTQGNCSDTSDCAVISYFGIEQHANAGLSVYPNPSNGLFSLVLTTEMDVEIFNAIGAIVYSERLVAGTHQLSLSVADGVYMLKAIAGNEYQYYKLVINK